jgi:hypothetical protein
MVGRPNRRNGPSSFVTALVQCALAQRRGRGDEHDPSAGPVGPHKPFGMGVRCTWCFVWTGAVRPIGASGRGAGHLSRLHRLTTVGFLAAQAMSVRTDPTGLVGRLP